MRPHRQLAGESHQLDVGSSACPAAGTIAPKNLASSPCSSGRGHAPGATPRKSAAQPSCAARLFGGTRSRVAVRARRPWAPGWPSPAPACGARASWLGCKRQRRRCPDGSRCGHGVASRVAARELLPLGVAQRPPERESVLLVLAAGWRLLAPALLHFAPEEQCWRHQSRDGRLTEPSHGASHNCACDNLDDRRGFTHTRP
jgi:hypothetical protein